MWGEREREKEKRVILKKKAGTRGGWGPRTTLEEAKPADHHLKNA